MSTALPLSLQVRFPAPPLFKVRPSVSTFLLFCFANDMPLFSLSVHV